MTEDYYVAKFGGRNVVAFPVIGKAGFADSALRCYQPDTLKRFLFRWGMQITARLGIPYIWEKISDEQMEGITGVGIHNWLTAISSSFSDGELFPVIIWPPEQSRKRIYVHLLNMRGNALGFAKIAMDSESNSKLQRECDVLQSLAKDDFQQFHVPAVIDHGVFDNNNYLIVEAIPETVKTYRASNIGFPQKAVKEYCGTIQDVSYAQIKQSNWYKKGCQSLNSNSCFMRELSAIPDTERGRLCRIHGDLGPSNLLQADGRLWIIDWEESCDGGPYLTDIISFYLALNRRWIVKKPREALRRLIPHILSGPYNASYVDIMMALAFLHGANFTLSSKLIDIWPRKENVVFDFAN